MILNQKLDKTKGVQVLNSIQVLDDIVIDHPNGSFKLGFTKNGVDLTVKQEGTWVNCENIVYNNLQNTVKQVIETLNRERQLTLVQSQKLGKLELQLNELKMQLSLLQSLPQVNTLNTDTKSYTEIQETGVIMPQNDCNELGNTLVTNMVDCKELSSETRLIDALRVVETQQTQPNCDNEVIEQIQRSLEESFTTSNSPITYAKAIQSQLKPSVSFGAESRFNDETRDDLSNTLSLSVNDNSKIDINSTVQVKISNDQNSYILQFKNVQVFAQKPRVFKCRHIKQYFELNILEMLEQTAIVQLDPKLKNKQTLFVIEALF